MISIRFQRAFHFGYWFAIRPCGMIVACKPMVEYESPRDLVEWLDQLFPDIDTRPPYVLYDKSCKVTMMLISLFVYVYATV